MLESILCVPINVAIIRFYPTFSRMLSQVGTFSRLLSGILSFGWFFPTASTLVFSYISGLDHFEISARKCSWITFWLCHLD